MNDEQWKFFFKELEKRLNFRYTYLDGKKIKAWDCDKSHRLSTNILSEMKIRGLEMEHAMDLLFKTGGKCDCEVIFNSKPKILIDKDPAKNGKRQY